MHDCRWARVPRGRWGKARREQGKREPVSVFSRETQIGVESCPCGGGAQKGIVAGSRSHRETYGAPTGGKQGRVPG